MRRLGRTMPWDEEGWPEEALVRPEDSWDATGTNWDAWPEESWDEEERGEDAEDEADEEADAEV